MGSSLTQGFNYVRLGSVTLTAAGGTLDIQNIPTGYTFLVAYISFESVAGVTDPFLRFNNDSAANHYTTQHWTVSGAVHTGGAVVSTQSIILNSAGAEDPCSFLLNVNQTPAASNKAFHCEGGTSQRIYQISAYWESAAEINRITLTASAGTFDAGSQMIIYGVR